MRTKFLVLLLLVSSLSMLFAPPLQAQSVMARKAIVVGKAALYGFGAGMVVGLASQVVKKKAKNIFVGGSLGMYVGIITGVYLVSTASPQVDYEGPDTYEDFSGWDSYLYEPPKNLQQARIDQPVDVPLLNVTLFSTQF